MKRKNLKPRFQWQRWSSEADDLAALPKTVAARMLFDVLLINRFELALLELKGSDAVWGPVHTSVGQEATAAATVAALRPGDKFAATYRSHHQFLAKALQYRVPADWDAAAAALPEAGLEVVRRTMAEIMGLAPGYCGGRGGSMHLRYPEAGFLGSNAIVGGGVPLAAGAAYAEKHTGSGNVVVAFVGDGALHQGALHEALNMVGLWDLPLICFVENNRYAVATSVQEASAVKDLSVRAAAYDMDAYIVDGSDPVAIYQVVGQVAGALREGGRPALIEAKCYRRFHHAGDVPGSAFRYRSREEEAKYARKEVTASCPRPCSRPAPSARPRWSGSAPAASRRWWRPWRHVPRAATAGAGACARSCGRSRTPRPTACAAPVPSGTVSPSANSGTAAATGPTAVRWPTPMPSPR